MQIIKKIIKKAELIWYSRYRLVYPGGIPPITKKRKLIQMYLEKFGAKYFIETGTHFGDTTDLISKNNDCTCYSIELDFVLYNKAIERFRKKQNVRLFHGDSSIILESILPELCGLALFWLDGHFSGPGTAYGKNETPILYELKIILKQENTFIILIDDARLFNGKNNYPSIIEIKSLIAKDGRYSFKNSLDIIQIMPKEYA